MGSDENIANTKKGFAAFAAGDVATVMDLMDDDDLARVQFLLLARPDAGKVIPKSGGLRKLRVAAKGHGKRGGARMIYYWVVARDRILLLDIYAKNEKEDLSVAEVKLLRTLIKEY